MARSNALTFISGRLISLVVLMAFQLLLVRILTPQEFAPYALVFALATLMQTVMSFGVPRIIAKYVGLAGWSVPNRAIRRLLLRLLGLRIAGTALLLALAAIAAAALGALDQHDGRLLLFGALYILIGVVQIDADSAAQALSLQKISRDCTILEALLRLLLVGGLALAGYIHHAVDVLALSSLTAMLATSALLFADLRRLSAVDLPAATQNIAKDELRATGLNGYASSLAWLASSPSIIRLIAGVMLPVTQFAGFAFIQGLVTSFQRYTPGALLFPFVEPTVMRNYARTGDIHQLEAGLSIVSKVDAIIIGAAMVGAVIAVRPVIELMTGGRYGEVAYAIPWLLVYVASIPIYRSFEIAALLLNTGSALTRTLFISMVWTLLAVIAATQFGLIALLIGPVGDALTRIAYLYRALSRRGARRAADGPVLASLAGLIALTSIVGLVVGRELAAGPWLQFAIGSGCALVYLMAAAFIRPLRYNEATLLFGERSKGIARIAARFSRPG